MAGVAVVSSVLEKVYQWKITLCAILPCINATATGGLIFGYSTGVSGGVSSVDPFLISMIMGGFVFLVGAAMSVAMLRHWPDFTRSRGWLRNII
ncbi:hypothetical protein AAC387_Pa12g2072 [Persea americana]